MAEKVKPSRPGEAALENMKLLKKESSVFKVPKVPKKKTIMKAQVLEEDIYIDGIAKIIQRNFFPDLEKLKAQNEFLEATENKDYARLREITHKYSGNRPPTEPYNSPATFDTPDIDMPRSPHSTAEKEDRNLVASNSADKETNKDITDIHSLDSFLANHTSEDNASYARVIALEDRKRASKLASQMEAELTAATQADKALRLPSIEQQADNSERPHEVDTWRYKARNYIMYVPEGAAGQARGARGELRHHNTRLRAPPFDYKASKQAISALAKSQGLASVGKIGVDGVSVCGGGVGGAGGEGALPLVPAASPAPGQGPDASPLMTWGHIEGTPFRLDGGDTPLPAAGAGAAYRMLETGARERLALRLAEQAARSRRPATPRHTPTTPTFRTNTERLASMSPAARKLAAKHLLSPRLKLTPNDMGILAHTHTPKRTPTPQRRLVARPPASVAGPPPETDNTLTDNLLQINVAKRTRLKAKDFFS